jgi:nucleotide-binding universal stress UspA family protein
MSEASQVVPFVKSIFHPSDFSNASELAFAHALAIALIRKTKLIIMHARRGEQEDWSKFPGVRKTLARWELLESGSHPATVFQKLGIAVVKVSARGDPVRVSMQQIQKQQPDLVVLATRGRHGLPLWLKPSVAQAIAQRTNAMTLFVPGGCRGIVSRDGTIQLRRILIPVDHEPNAREALIRAVRAAEAFGDEAVEISVLHVNGGSSRNCIFPRVRHGCGKNSAARETL